jgi:hypothetical protein
MMCKKSLFCAGCRALLLNALSLVLSVAVVLTAFNWETIYHIYTQGEVHQTVCIYLLLKKSPQLRCVIYWVKCILEKQQTHPWSTLINCVRLSTLHIQWR